MFQKKYAEGKNQVSPPNTCVLVLGRVFYHDKPVYCTVPVEMTVFTPHTSVQVGRTVFTPHTSVQVGMTVFSVQPTGRNDRENLEEIRLCLKIMLKAKIRFPQYEYM